MTILFVVILIILVLVYIHRDKIINIPTDQIGIWSDWSICKEGKQNRTCTNPTQAKGKITCKGPVERSCDPSDCSGSGGNMSWSNWTPCNKRCGKGIKTRKLVDKSKSDGIFNFTVFYPGINLIGFDWGEIDGGNYGKKHGYMCISNNIIDWVINENKGVKMIRFPISPEYIFTKNPIDMTFLDDSNPTGLSSIFTGYYNDINACELTDTINWNDQKGSYMDSLMYATSKKIFSILDIHADARHLCALTSDDKMSPEMFVSMWKNIAKYVITIDPNHQYIMFELFNEPVNDGCADSIIEDVWYNDYVIPAIIGIREIESNMNSYKHIIIATTFGDWSGVHSWKDTNTLERLVEALTNKKLNNSPCNKVLIAGHQYCDSNYSGLHPEGCDANKFAKDKQVQWIEYVDTLLANNNLKWIMTEGNITCMPERSCNNIDLWKSWLAKLKDSKTCVGFSVWYVNPYQKKNNSMGGGTSNEESFKVYQDVYKITNNKYDFSDYYKSYNKEETETAECNNNCEDIDCKMSEWSEWSECDMKCVYDGKIAQQYKRRNIDKIPQGNGKPCGSDTHNQLQSKQCSPQPAQCDFIKDYKICDEMTWSKCCDQSPVIWTKSNGLNWEKPVCPLNKEGACLDQNKSTKSNKVCYQGDPIQ